MLTRRQMLIGSSAAVVAGLNLSKPETAEAAIPPLFVSWTFGDFLITGLTVLGGLVVNAGLNIAMPELRENAIDEFNTWLNTASTAFRDAINTAWSAIQKAGSFLIKFITPILRDAFLDFSAWLLTHTGTPGNVTIGDYTFDFSLQSYEYLTGQFPEYESLTYGLSGSAFFGKPTDPISSGSRRITGVGAASNLGTIALSDTKLVDKLITLIQFDPSSGFTMTQREAASNLFRDQAEMADGTKLTNEILSSFIPSFTSTSEDYSVIRYYPASTPEKIYSDNTYLTFPFSKLSEIVFATDSLILFYELESQYKDRIIGIFDTQSNIFYPGLSSFTPQISGTVSESPWEKAGDLPSDVVIDGSTIVGNDLVIGNEGTVTDQGSISIPVTPPLTWNDTLVGTGTGVITGDVSSGITTGSGAIAGSGAGAVSGTLGELVGGTTSTGGSTTNNSISAQFPWGDIVLPNIPRVFPFSLPWDVHDFLNALLQEPSFPDSFTIPFITGYAGTHNVVLDLKPIKELRNLLIWPVRIFWTGIVIKFAMNLTHRES